MRWLSALASILLFIAPAAAQETRSLAPGAASPPARIEQLSWLAGTWRGEGLGASATEVYSSPRAGQIAGHFFLEGKDGIAFYELMQIVPRDGSLVYRLRHFNADLTGWEDETGKAVEFPLVAIDQDAAWFDGLTLKRDGADGMTVWVRIADEDGATKEAVFRYRRVSP